MIWHLYANIKCSYVYRITCAWIFFCAVECVLVQMWSWECHMHFIQSVEDKYLEQKILNERSSTWQAAKYLNLMLDVQAENANMQLMQLIEGRNALNWWILEQAWRPNCRDYTMPYNTIGTTPNPNAPNWWGRLQLQLDCTNLSIGTMVMASTMILRSDDNQHGGDYAGGWSH